MNTAEILRAAKARTDTPEKWYRRGELDDDCRECAQTAITNVAETGGPSCSNDDPALAIFAKVIGWDAATSESPDYAAIWRWNDATGRTHAEVMDAFDRAIALAEQEQA